MNTKSERSWEDLQEGRGISVDGGSCITVYQIHIKWLSYNISGEESKHTEK